MSGGGGGPDPLNIIDQDSGYWTTGQHRSTWRKTQEERKSHSHIRTHGQHWIIFKHNWNGIHVTKTNMHGQSLASKPCYSKWPFTNFILYRIMNYARHLAHFCQRALEKNVFLFLKVHYNQTFTLLSLATLFSSAPRVCHFKNVVTCRALWNACCRSWKKVLTSPKEVQPVNR